MSEFQCTLPRNVERVLREGDYLEVLILLAKYAAVGVRKKKETFSPRKWKLEWDDSIKVLSSIIRLGCASSNFLNDYFKFFSHQQFLTEFCDILLSIPRDRPLRSGFNLHLSEILCLLNQNFSSDLFFAMEQNRFFTSQKKVDNFLNSLEHIILASDGQLNGFKDEFSSYIAERYRKEEEKESKIPRSPPTIPSLFYTMSLPCVEGLEHIVQNEASSSITEKWMNESKAKYSFRSDEYICKCSVRGCCCDPGECENADLKRECDYETCPCGSFCKNQRLQRFQYPKMEIFECNDERGYGVRVLEDVKRGSLIAEYVGEVMTLEEHRNRKNSGASRADYGMILDSSFVIDAERKGNVARYINHSCSPNCVAEKWKVMECSRIGIFALSDISFGEEVTYDYNLGVFEGRMPEKCLCGAKNCRGFIGNIKDESSGSDSLSHKKRRIS